MDKYIYEEIQYKKDILKVLLQINDNLDDISFHLFDLKQRFPQDT